MTRLSEAQRFFLFTVSSFPSSFARPTLLELLCAHWDDPDLDERHQYLSELGSRLRRWIERIREARSPYARPLTRQRAGKPKWGERKWRLLRELEAKEAQVQNECAELCVVLWVRNIKP